MAPSDGDGTSAGVGEELGAAGLDWRGRRRQQTLAEVLERAVGIMRVDGVAGLSMAALAREMSIKPPSLYKYYPS